MLRVSQHCRLLSRYLLRVSQPSLLSPPPLRETPVSARLRAHKGFVRASTSRTSATLLR
jgi:hypothetical protein